ncbi:UDP-N-acetylmuramoyl-tripeptide--D-alanyl-D-alanine ligase [Maribacter sp. MMG018]|uniref:UDP-N-acetylmuramoyl-tripeptide--D-alanyl-D- alanine ligase n=2 Tax=Maribacter sp. MMG018 TaxID=2822688 RepID=UPI001B37D344|nr:UDP-N-acetylmuramoyl-tripeptide--D-alanyl-D-alanine ligase [Maribacter sp. MMG018]MBQ4915991.1 UDP-N-acetylmuramoyl-tripeptide--D-alanyl-D-alanine ligase [Maribacter sp. MMG018]
MTINELHTIFLDNPSINTDTRKLRKGDIFFALKGANFNGNKYAAQALQNGASYAVIDEKEFLIDHRTILVDDVLRTLQHLGNYHRKQSKATVIGLTGSNGKTTTKELINAVLSQKYRTIATKGNLNNHIGVPLTLLSIKEDTEIAIVEMGANHLKEIAFLCELAEPDFGYITNFGKAHLEGFGSEQGVINGKSELYDYLISNNKGVFLNADDPVQKQKLDSYIKKYGFSSDDPKFYPIHFKKADPFVVLEVENITIHTKLLGAYNFTNCCAAIIMGKYFNVPLEHIKTSLEAYTPDNNRSQIINKNELKVILDAYNANPSSMRAALENFSKMNDDNKVLFLGDMFELGDSSLQEHDTIARLAVDLGFSNVVLIGENFKKVDCGFDTFGSFEKLKEEFKNIEIPVPATVLIKGSRGMALERILELL